VYYISEPKKRRKKMSAGSEDHDKEIEKDGIIEVASERVWWKGLR
jgi:hypothetical protein